jgi:succinate-semialdehyde dehydrogenase
MNFQQYIDGQWLNAANGKTWNVLDPATEETIATVPFGDATDARAALQAAKAAFPGWSGKTPYERAAILLKAANLIRDRVDDLAPIMTRECGKPFIEARGEWIASADLLEWFAEEGKRAYGRTVPSRRANKRVIVLHQPIGVVATITAWNFPAWLLARAWGAALAAGCTVVGRPSELTPMSAMALTNILVEAGIPAGVLNLVNGDPESQGAEFLNNPICRKISFTGSTRVGKLLMRGAAENITRLSLELGGSAPVLVFPDVDLDWAAKQSVASKFRNNGQVCVSPQRFYVHADVQEPFLDKVQALVRDLKIGHGLDKETNVGPLVTAGQRDKVEALAHDAIGKGATVVVGGSRPADRAKGYFFQPTVLTGIGPEMRIAREEIFGPVMPIVTFHTVEEALALANDTEYGLASYVLTHNLDTAIRMYEGLEFGIVGVNDMLPTATEAPFGGMKQSGIEREQGSEGLAKYLETKMVSIAL